MAGVPTAPHRARSETGPSPQVFEKILRLEYAKLGFVSKPLNVWLDNHCNIEMPLYDIFRVFRAGAR